MTDLEGEYIEDTTSEISTEGHTPLTREDSPSVTSNGSITPEFENNGQKFFDTKAVVSEVEEPVLLRH